MAESKEYIDNCIEDINVNFSQIFEEIFAKGVAQGVSVINQTEGTKIALSEKEAQLIAFYRSCDEDERALLLMKAQSGSQQNVIYLKRQGNKIYLDSGNKYKG